MPNSTPYRNILTEDELNRYAAELIGSDKVRWIAIDSEFVRVDTYFPELSLVQIQDNCGEIALIDPLAIGSGTALQGLIDLLIEPTLLKVFHSARQDLEVLYQVAQTLPVSIFDTQLAAIFFGHGDTAGFARVVEKELDHTLDKSQTRTDWHARPLTSEQLEYAIDDVRYLAPLYEKFAANLTEEQRQAVEEDCAALLNESLYQPDPARAGEKVKGTRNFKPKQLAIVHALAEWRERYAIEHNRPKKWTLSDEVIAAIAKRPPQVAEALYKVPNIKSSSVKTFGQEWIECIDRVFASDPESWPQPAPKPPRPTPQEEVLLTLCQSVCQQVAIDYRINLPNLLNKMELMALIQHPDQSDLIGWRKLLIAYPLQKLLSGENHLAIHHQKLTLSCH